MFARALKFISPSLRAKRIEKELQMLKPGLKLIIKDELSKKTTQATMQKTPIQEYDGPSPTLKPHGLVASWIWDLFKKENKLVEKKGWQIRSKNIT